MKTFARLLAAMAREEAGVVVVVAGIATPTAALGVDLPLVTFRVTYKQSMSGRCAHLSLLCMSTMTCRPRVCLLQALCAGAMAEVTCGAVIAHRRAVP